MLLTCIRGIQACLVGRISWTPVEMLFESNWNAFLWVSPIKHKKHTKSILIWCYLQQISLIKDKYTIYVMFYVC